MTQRILLAGFLLSVTLIGCQCTGGKGNASCRPATCREAGARCGTIDDGCGGQLDCGFCGGGLACGAETPNQCGGASDCTPTTCEAIGAQCGFPSDGCGGQLVCGFCDGGASCTGSYTCRLGGCEPKTCASAGAQCGTLPDGCGGSLDCGSDGACAGDLICGGDGANRCGDGTCTPKTCDAGACGLHSDACGAAIDCGTCDGLKVCTWKGKCEDVSSSIGQSCQSNADCSAGLCLTQSGDGWPGGLCTSSCTDEKDCGRGNTCTEKDASGLGICAESCTTDADCTRAGYACYDPDNDGIRACLPSGTGTGTIGAPCDSLADCGGNEGALCLTESQGLPDGYCSKTCPPGGTTGCPAGSHCSFTGSGACVDNCAQDADCRDGYSCRDWDGDGKDECAPAAPIGAPCTADGDCASGTCDTTLHGGYCTQTCSADTDCPQGSLCADGGGGAKTCRTGCRTDADCRSSGYACLVIGDSGLSVCGPYGDGGGDPGDGCQSVADCGGGATATCLSDGYPGGYCTTVCESDADCPGTAVCRGSGTNKTCQGGCSATLACRGGYTCTNGACTPGEVGDGSPGSSCESSTDCNQGTCATAADGYPGGFCQTGCATDKDCPGDLSCKDTGTGGGNVCTQPCSSGADCRFGYACQDGSCVPDDPFGNGNPTGSPCTDHSQCERLFCMEQSSWGWRGGYCSGACVKGEEGHCEVGSHCTTFISVDGVDAALCIKDCTGDADCRDGYQCWDKDGDGVKECAPVAVGDGKVGDPCDTIDECSGGKPGTCIVPLSGMPDGYCSYDCDSGCPTGSHCAGEGDADICMDEICCESYRRCNIDPDTFEDDCPTGETCENFLDGNWCVLNGKSCHGTLACPGGSICSDDNGGLCKVCTSDNRCRNDYECFDWDDSGNRECVPAAKGNGNPGTPCTHISQCAGGVKGSCAPENADGDFKGGSCMWDCSDGNSCPGGTACTRFGDANNPSPVAFCLPTCSSNANCRDGYTCQDLDANGGPKTCFPE